jgi:hypothetical protein
MLPHLHDHQMRLPFTLSRAVILSPHMKNIRTFNSSKRRSFLTPFFMAGMAGALFAQATPKSLTEVDREAIQGDYVHPSTGIVLPPQLGNMKAVGEIINYEEKQPGLGFARNYTSSNGKAGVYLYNLGLIQIDKEQRNVLLEKALGMAENEIESLGSMGIYSDVSPLGRTSVPWGDKRGTESLKSSYSYKQNGQQLISHIYILVVNDHFMKIRISYDGEDNPMEQKAFLKDLGDSLPPKD